MKRIISVSLKNFKAYLTPHDIKLPNGENLLVYGENGSGKSSFGKAIMHYLGSAVNVNMPFLYNQTGEEGYIKLSFADYDEQSNSIFDNSQQSYISSSVNVNSDNSIDFIKEASVTTGFLDYLSLLEVFLVGDDKKKFFDFVTLKLLGGFVALSGGATKSFSRRWKALNDKLLVKSTSRNTKTHKEGLGELSSFEADLRNTLDKVFQEVNKMLTTYFPHFSLSIQYELDRMGIVYGNRHLRSDWKISKGFQLKVLKGGIQVGNYRMVLNEARLSAISICLYLASLKQIPKTELWLLVLDDVFIGIDSSNRLPFLRLLTNEFSQYQIMLLTYDRGWYNLARTYLLANVNQKWITKELYNGEVVRDGKKFFNPLVIDGKSSMDKARSYLYSSDHPDYPASANYFRKAIEEMLALKVPNKLMKNEEAEQIEPYKLTHLVNRLYRMLSNLHDYKEDLSLLLASLNYIKTMLSPLIHPLSHYADNEVYRSELIELDKNVALLAEQLTKVDLLSNVRILLDKGTPLKITFIGDGSWHFEYYYKLNECVCVYNNASGGKSLSPCGLNIYKMQGTDGAGTQYVKKIGKKDFLFSTLVGTSIEERVNGLYAFISNAHPVANFVLDANNYVNHVSVLRADNNHWRQLTIR